jgi:hypothetical protein
MNTISLKKLSEQIKIDFYQLEKYIKYLNKDIIIENNVKKVNLDEYLGIMITHYFLTLFTYDCPLELSLRIIDLFWVYEEKVIFDIVIVLLKSKQDKLMTMDKEDIMVYLKKNLVFDVIKEKGIDFIMNSI